MGHGNWNSDDIDEQDSCLTAGFDPVMGPNS